MEAINDMWALKETCREAFECTKSAPSAMQQQVSETLRHMGLSVKDEVRCPKSGYSIDMIVVHDSGRGIGGERSSSTGTSWAVEFDGPSHFLANRAPTGGTLLKRRHLTELLGHVLVIVPYWEDPSAEYIHSNVRVVEFISAPLQAHTPVAQRLTVSSGLGRFGSGG